MRSGADEEVVTLHDAVGKGREGFGRIHLRVNNCSNDRQFPMGIKEKFAEGCDEHIECVAICDELIVVIFDPIIDSNILE